MWKHVLYGAVAFWYIQLSLLTVLYEAGWMSWEENQVIAKFVVGYELLAAIVGMAATAIGIAAWLGWDLLRFRLRSCATTVVLVAIACLGFGQAAHADLLLPVRAKVTNVTPDSITAVRGDTEFRFPANLLNIPAAAGDSLLLEVVTSPNMGDAVKAWKMSDRLARDTKGPRALPGRTDRSSFPQQAGVAPTSTQKPSTKREEP